MKKITVYDPAMCCSTGVCGPEVEPRFVQFASDLDWLKNEGIAVERYNLAQQPDAFVSQSLVREMLAAQGNGCLPLILVDGAIATRSIYPNREQLATLAGIEAEDSCCSDSTSGCCD